MALLALQFAEAQNPEGIAALGLNLKGFLFQLTTFVLLLLVLKRWVFPRLVATLEKRREVLERSLVQARQTEEALQSAESKASELLRKARLQADAALEDAKKQTEAIISKAEAVAVERSERILKESESQLEQQSIKLREQLRNELAELVVLTTEKVIERKLDDKNDRALIESSLKEMAR
ncbi:F0F1 ATP synthase subunit B [Candidatus Saccharibacteria bacterium]|nr:F0F1 ATP synthase subunit B [Candidatus Saccharibacteria bacterium]